MAITKDEIIALLKEQIIDPEQGTLLLQPVEELPCIYDLLEAYIPDRLTGLEILEAEISSEDNSAMITGYASFFGLPPVKMEAKFSIITDPNAVTENSTIGVNNLDVSLTILVIPEMGVTPAGLFPELTGSGLWVPLIALKLELKSHAESQGVIQISSGLNPGLDDLLGPLGHLLGEFAAKIAPVTGSGEVGESGTLIRLNIHTDPLHSLSFGMVELSNIKIALAAEENENGLLQAALLLEGRVAIHLNNKTIDVDFSLIPAPPDRPFHVLSAHLSEEDGQTAETDGLGIPMPPGIPAKLNLQSIRVLLGAVSGVPEDITIAALLASDSDSGWTVLPGLSVKELGGVFTVWPTVEPISGRAEIYGTVILGGETLHFNLDIPEMDFSVELDPQSKPNIKNSIEQLTSTTMPDFFPDMVIDGLTISGNIEKKFYHFYFGLTGEWDFKELIGLELSLKSINITGNIDAKDAQTVYYGKLQGLIQIGEEPPEGETADGLLQLSAEVTKAGEWIFEGGLAQGSVLSLPQLVSLIGIHASDLPHDLRSLVITELNASLYSDSGKATFHAASGFSLPLPFGGGNLDLKGSVSLTRESKTSDWAGDASGEMKFKTLRLKVTIPLNKQATGQIPASSGDPVNNQTENSTGSAGTSPAGDQSLAQTNSVSTGETNTPPNAQKESSSSDLKISLWLPQGGNPEEGNWLDCNIDQNSSGSIEKLTIILSHGLNIFGAIEGFINLMIPGFELKFPPPWDKLKEITLPPTKIIINPVENSVELMISDCFDWINEFPGINIKSIGLLYDTDDSKIEFKLVGQIFDDNYTENAPLTFDPVSADPPVPKIPDAGFDLRYLGFGRHVAMRNAAQYSKVRQAIDDLQHAFDTNPREGSSALGPLRYSSESEWLVGFDFTAGGFLRLGVLFNDPVLYGLNIRLDGPAAKIFSGFEFEILYRRIAPGLGVYSIELELPAAIRTIELGAITLRLPVVAVDIYTNGNFKIDLGFPYGGNFARSFYISVLPFAGAGGFYYASLNGATSTTVPRIVNGQFDPVIEFGIGLTVGFGKSFGSGCFQASIYIGLFAILEGCFATFLPYDRNLPEAQFFRISGSFGIRAILAGKIDFSIICISFTVELYIIASIVVESYMPIYIRARAGVRISAKVKIGWFKISLHFSTSISISFTLGSRRPTPWIIGNAMPARMGRGFGYNKIFQNRNIPMTMPGAAMESVINNTFDWSNIPVSSEKINLTWFSWFGVSADLDSLDVPSAGLSRIHVASPLAGFAEQILPGSDSRIPPADFTVWLEYVFHWMIEAWHSGQTDKILFPSAERMDRRLQEQFAAESIDWKLIENFIKENFTVTLKAQPPAEEGKEYKMSLVPLPPVLQIHFDIGGEIKDIDLSVGPLVNKTSLADIKNRSFRYATDNFYSAQSGQNSDNPAAAEATMAEWLWKDIISLQIKELASRLLALMEACPVKMSGSNAFVNMSEIYENLVYDPDPSDADREPYFEEFIEANMGKTGLFKTGLEIIIPLENGEKSYTLADSDTLEKIADDNGITAVELAAANLYSDIIAPESVWTIPYIKELSVSDAWTKLVDAKALNDISAMTSRFLLHGVRIPVQEKWTNLYEAGLLQFNLPIFKKSQDTAAGDSSASISLTDELFRKPVSVTVSPSSSREVPLWMIFENAVDAKGQLELIFSESEDQALKKILLDNSFIPEGTVTAMDMVRDEELDFTMARAISVRRWNSETKAVENYGRFRVLPSLFFSFLESLKTKQLETILNNHWYAAPMRKKGSKQNSEESEPVRKFEFQWVTRLDIEIMALEKEAQVEGRSIYRVAPLSSTAQLKLEQLLSDAQKGLIQLSVAPAAGVAGPVSQSGGLLIGKTDLREIVLFRNDADERPDTPASADNTMPLDFLQLLAETFDQESGTFFFADVLPGISDAEERIFAGGKKGTITLVVYPSGQINPARHADCIYLTEDADKGAEAMRLCADGLTKKKARFEPDMLHFRMERPEPDEETADALESLYSLFSFYFSDEDGSNPSPPSLPVGPREETSGVWLYEQVVPAASAFVSREKIQPYSAVGTTRYLNITWRDLFGNEATSADYPFDGYENPLAEKKENLSRIPLTCYYYDEIIGVNRWPGTQTSHIFQSGPGGIPQLCIQIQFDPSMFSGSLFSENDKSSGDSLEEISKVIAQLQDGRMLVFLQTSLEESNSLETELKWKSALEKFLTGIKNLMIEARNLVPLEIVQKNELTIENFLMENRISPDELAKAIRSLPAKEFFSFADPAAAVMPVLKVPIKWQTGTDSINSIAAALKINPDVLIETLSAVYSDKPGLLKEGVLENSTGDKSVKISASLSIADAAAGFEKTPSEFLIEFADRENLLGEKIVLTVAELNEVLRPDESTGEFARRMLYYIETEIIGGSAASGFTLAPDMPEILEINKLVKIQKGFQVLLENRLIAPQDITAGKIWKQFLGNGSSQTGSASPEDVSVYLGVSVADFVVLNSQRADIIQPGVKISIDVTGKNEPAKTIAIKTAKNETLTTLRKVFSDQAGQTLSAEQFADAISKVNLLKTGVFYMAPPLPVVLKRGVKPRKNPAAYELKSQIVLQRFNREPSPEDLALIHPQVHDQTTVWYIACDIAPSVVNAQKENNEAANLRPYAESFEKTMGPENLHLGMGAKRKTGSTNDRPSLWAVRLGAGGFSYQFDSAKPAFLSLRPLATTPMNRKKVPVFKFMPDKANFTLDAGEDSYEIKNYSEIDFDDWAKRTLELLDRTLNPAAALAFGEAGITEKGNSLDKLLAARAKLAASLTIGLTEVIEYIPGGGKAEPNQSDVTRRIMKERIGNRLASAYDMDTAVFIPLDFKNAGGEIFEAGGSFKEDRSVATDTGYTLQATSFERNEDYLAMVVDVLKPEEHRRIDTKAAFQLETFKFQNNENDEILLSFIIPPEADNLGKMEIPVPLRDMPEAPRLSRQQGVADFEMNADGYPEIDSFDDLLAWRYEVDYMAGFAEQDTHTMEIFFNLRQLEELPPMLGGYNGRLFQDLFHALAQCDSTLQNYADTLKNRVESKFKNADQNRADLHWILDDLTILVDELADHWREHYERGGAAIPMALGETLKTTKHRYEFIEERYEQLDTDGNKIKDDLRYVFKCAPGDPAPVVWVDGIEGKTSKPKIKKLPDGEEQAVFTVTLADWFNLTQKTTEDLNRMPRRFGFTGLHILEKQNVRVRIKTVRNAELLEGQTTAEAFIYRTPVVTLPDRFFPSVEMEKRVKVEYLVPKSGRKKYTHPTELLADVLHYLLGLGYGVENAGIKRRLALSVRYGFSMAGDWKDTASFASETPLFFEPRFILDHVPDTTNGVAPNTDDALSRMGRELKEWMDTAGARRENAGFVIGIDVFTDETLNPALAEKNPGDIAARDDARLIRIMRLEADFPEG